MLGLSLVSEKSSVLKREKAKLLAKRPFRAERFSAIKRWYKVIIGLQEFCKPSVPRIQRVKGKVLIQPVRG